MALARQRSAHGGRPDSGRRAPSISTMRLAVLVVLGIWAAAYQLHDTTSPWLLTVAPFDGVWPDVAFGVAGVMLIARGWREEHGWALIGIGALCWAAGDVYWQLKLANLTAPPVPSWADAGYLLFCPFAFAGILSLVRGRARVASRPLIADALAAGLAAGAVSAAVVLRPVMAHARGGFLAVATNLAYPICDLALLGLLIGAMAIGEWRPDRRLLLLAAAVFAFWIADSSYLTAVATNTYSQTQWYNGLWYLSPVLAAWAGWLPASARSAVAVQRGTSARGIVMLLGFALVAIAVLIVANATVADAPAIALATLALLVILGRLVMTWRENVALLRDSQLEAVTDSLTGLRNRRALTAELEHRASGATRDRPIALALFDLDGFKHYNDSFGHPAGDSLLQRLGAKLADSMANQGIAYRMGGDEFCTLIETPAAGLNEAIHAAAAALSERGEGFAIGCSYGSVILPLEVTDAETALRVVDQRMYMQKRGGRAAASRQSSDVLLRAVEERNPDLYVHLRDVAELAVQTARAFNLRPEEVQQIRQAAELHDVGKVAIPDAILNKPGPLDEDEWEFIRRHTLIGERIVTAAPALLEVGRLVRSSHENFDGTGYPDQLRGEAIPLGSRIIFACDAFHAITTDRPHHKAIDEPQAIAELRRCAGTQFDPAVVGHLAEALERRARHLAHAA